MVRKCPKPARATDVAEEIAEYAWIASPAREGRDVVDRRVCNGHERIDCLQPLGDRREQSPYGSECVGEHTLCLGDWSGCFRVRQSVGLFEGADVGIKEIRFTPRESIHA